MFASNLARDLVDLEGFDGRTNLSEADTKLKAELLHAVSMGTRALKLDDLPPVADEEQSEVA